MLRAIRTEMLVITASQNRVDDSANSIHFLSHILGTQITVHQKKYSTFEVLNSWSIICSLEKWQLTAQNADYVPEPSQTIGNVRFSLFT